MGTLSILDPESSCKVNMNVKVLTTKYGMLKAKPK